MEKGWVMRCEGDIYVYMYTYGRRGGSWEAIPLQESKMDDGGENGGYKGVVDVCESVFARKRV